MPAILPEFTAHTISYHSEGKDQLGRMVGKPQEGDVSKVHVAASYIAKRPKFKLGSWKVGKEKDREQEFLDTKIVGDTAFFSLPITSASSKKGGACHTFADILAACAAEMKLGETASFRFDLDEKSRLLLSKSVHKGHYKSVPDDATGVCVVLDSFRIVRGKTEHFRTSRNGTGASMPGSFGMQ